MSEGNFFEDFRIGQVFHHATPRTITEGDVALCTALTGSRFAVNSSVEFARRIGFKDAPIDDLLVFNIVFGKSVADISQNAVANLGYAEGRFDAAVYPGDTLQATSSVIGLRETANRKTGVLWVRTTGRNQRGETVVEYVRWVMVAKRDPGARAPSPVVPQLAAAVSPDALAVPPELDLARYDAKLAGDPRRWGDFKPGERFDHVDGVTIEDAEHQLATRLYQNTARVHFDRHLAAKGRFAKRLVYGGHVISLARALSFNGLANAFKIAAINGGRHAAPVVAGDTLYAWSEVLDRHSIPGRADVGALRLRTVAAKDHPCDDFPWKSGLDADHPAVVLEFDYSVLVPC